MKTASGYRLGLALILAPWAAAAIAVAAYFAVVHWANDCQCGSDTECMEMHGGDGSPDSPEDPDA